MTVSTPPAEDGTIQAIVFVPYPSPKIEIDVAYVGQMDMVFFCPGELIHETGRPDTTPYGAVFLDQILYEYELDLWCPDDLTVEWLSVRADSSGVRSIQYGAAGDLTIYVDVSF